ncbi:MAG TPA: alpha/beta fold hydrolase [Steroidobacteraceae bacterium]|nr:alpha/beta fold hydrolase [Steroidobacteraceae bacterium]
MSRHSFVLIAGAWHGAWCWSKVKSLLVAGGHQVITPELPGTGADSSDPSRVTLESWARSVARTIENLPQPVTLVGHSRGGIVISRTAELVPERLRRLVYVSAYLLPSGGTLAQAARADGESLVPPHMIPAEGGVTCNLDPAVIRSALFGHCSDADYEYALAHMSPEPLKPLVSPVKVTAQRFGSVPRAYIECLEDRTVTLAAQRRMQAELPCDPVFTLDSDHSPFLSHPQDLARLLGGL